MPFLRFNKSILLLSALILASKCDAQTMPSIEARFLQFLNNYDLDSLDHILSEEFYLHRDFAEYSNNKKSFLEEYVPQSKGLHASFSVIQIIPGESSKQYLVLDKSDYFTILHIPEPMWKMTIQSSDSLITEIFVEKTERYEEYIREIEHRDNQFSAWLYQYYPNETRSELLKNSPLFLIRLKEFALTITP